jgi:hypothetical protein
VRSALARLLKPSYQVITAYPSISFLLLANANFKITKRIIVKAATCKMKPFDKALKTEKNHCPAMASSKIVPNPFAF